MADVSAGVLRVGNIAVDVRIRETHKLSMNLTSYGIESGKNISEHIIADPNEVEIEFEVTNTDGGRERAKKAFQDFVSLMEKRTPVDIITEHATYHNMVFVGFPSEHSAPNLGTLRATARFQQAGITGDDRKITEGRNEERLSGYPFQRMYVGNSRESFSDRQNKDVTYRTGCEFIDSGIQSIQSAIKNAAKYEKVAKKLINYAKGIF